MKKNIKIILSVFVLLAGLFVVTGCEKDPTKDFKNPKTIILKGDKGTLEVTYDDDGTYEENNYAAGGGKILRNSDKNFRFGIEFVNKTIKEMEQTKENLGKDKTREVIDVEYRKNKGFVAIDQTWGTADVYLYVDEANDVIVNLRVSPNTSEKMKSAKEAKELIYGQETVQQILRTVKYTANK